MHWEASRGKIAEFSFGGDSGVGSTFDPILNRVADSGKKGSQGRLAMRLPVPAIKGENVLLQSSNVRIGQSLPRRIDGFV